MSVPPPRHDSAIATLPAPYAPPSPPPAALLPRCIAACRTKLSEFTIKLPATRSDHYLAANKTTTKAAATGSGCCLPGGCYDWCLVPGAWCLVPGAWLVGEPL
ncbi:hypothetical protein AWZ03_010973 [Drosophila navojoa]|uniref:Uncharacterized protein n=1 Tax=Drosophila navojoa TaxID=7232 RepID=A0A484B2W6_DRONA|nr:hypothetical protein AWZ03_010973 [Drosophila navojoa]